MYENSLIVKLLLGELISEKDLENELYEICDRVHSTCDYECPVYELLTEEERKSGCIYHKRGKAMAEVIRERMK